MREHRPARLPQRGGPVLSPDQRDCHLNLTQEEQLMSSQELTQLPAGWQKRIVVQANGCWDWTGATSNGFGVIGRFVDGQRTCTTAHRLIYSMLRDKVPPGMRMHHRCHEADETCRSASSCPHRRCVNPDHVVPVTMSEARSLAVRRIHRSRTNPEMGGGRKDRSPSDLPQRLALRIFIDPAGCWLWLGSRSPQGYGMSKNYTDGSKNSTTVHRIVYEILVGPIPPGLVIDHLCMVRHCVNPEHLEAVTYRENMQRAMRSPSGANGRKHLCSKGHPLSGDNLYQAPGSPNQRQCRTCREDYKRKARRAA